MTTCFKTQDLQLALFFSFSLWLYLIQKRLVMDALTFEYSLCWPWNWVFSLIGVWKLLYPDCIWMQHYSESVWDKFKCFFYEIVQSLCLLQGLNLPRFVTGWRLYSFFSKSATAKTSATKYIKEMHMHTLLGWKITAEKYLYIDLLAMFNKLLQKRKDARFSKTCHKNQNK